MSSDHHYQQIQFHSRLSWCCLFVSIPEIGTFGNTGLGAVNLPNGAQQNHFLGNNCETVKNYLTIQQHVVGV